MIIWVCERCNEEQDDNPLRCWNCGYTVYRPVRPQPVDNPVDNMSDQGVNSVSNPSSFP